MAKPLINCFFGPNLHKKVVNIGHAQNEKQFFGINNKSRSSSFRNFLFHPNIICFGSIMNLFLYWVMFFVKNVSFPAKAVVTSPKNLQKQWRFLYSITLCLAIFNQQQLRCPHICRRNSWPTHIFKPTQQTGL